MHRPGHEHEDERQYERENVDPKRISKELKTKSADEHTAYVPPEQRAGLRCGCASKTKQEDG